MEASTSQVGSEKVLKRQFANQTKGWLGVVVLNARGDEIGAAVPPEGTVWLSEAEVILTARAPAQAADNPFEEQTFVVFNAELQRREEVRYRPLVPISDDRAVPANDRYIPPNTPVPHMDAQAQVDATAAQPQRSVLRDGHADKVAQVGAVVPPEPTPHMPQPPPPPSAPGALPAPPAQVAPAFDIASDADPVSWTEKPDGDPVVSGALGGSVEPAPTADAAGGGAEEHAATAPAVQEETGAAQPPNQPPAEGEFAAAEEVGSPDAPTAHEPTSTEG